MSNHPCELLATGVVMELNSECSKGFFSYIAGQRDSIWIITEPVNAKGERLHGVGPGFPLQFTVYIEQIPYQIQAEIVWRENSRLGVKIQGELTRVQRRHFYRVDAQISFALRFSACLHEEGNRRVRQAKELTLCTDDISAGGLAFTCRETDAPFQDCPAEGILYLSDEQHLPFQAQVVRVEPGQKADQKKIAVQFVGMPEAFRTQMVSSSYWMTVNRKKA